MRANKEILLRRSQRLASQSPSPSPSPSPSDLRLKLSLVISRHHNLKVAFKHLHSEIRGGLVEAEEVFASLAVPLVHLVGMKTAQIAEQGRTTNIITTHSIPMPYGDSHPTFIEESFANKVNMAGKELLQQQKHQLLQLVHTLEQIKSEVTSSQDDILQTLANRKQSFQRFFLKVVNYIQVIYQSREDDNFLFTVKVLKAVFNNVGVTLCSVEDGVEELINNIVEKMYNPMVKYVHAVKEEMAAGTCPRLLSIVAEMEREMRIGRLQLEESKLKVKELEKSRIQFLRLLKGSEEGLMTTKDHTGNVLGDGKCFYRHAMPQKVSGIPPDGKADDKLLWEMLKKKRRRIAQKPHQSMIPRVPLGSSPSATAQEGGLY